MDYSKFSNETLKKLANNEELDYSKLNDDELRELANETPVDQPSFEKYSGLESLARGAAQGASFGFADELTAAAEAALSDKSYDKALAESRAEYKASEEEDPITAFLGNVAGGVVVPGIGAGAAGAKLGSSIGRLALTGAAGGAITGLGQSEAADIGGMASDVAEGAVGGAALGTAIGGVAKGVQKAADIAKGTQFVKDLMDSVKLGYKGESLVGKKLNLEDDIRKHSQKILNDLQKNRKVTQSDYGQLYKIIDDYSKQTGTKNPNAYKLLDDIKKLEQGTEINKEAAEMLKTAVGDVHGLTRMEILDEVPVRIKNMPEEVEAKATEGARAKMQAYRTQLAKEIEERQAAGLPSDDIQTQLDEADAVVQMMTDETTGKQAAAATLKKPELQGFTETGNAVISPGKYATQAVADKKPEVVWKQIKTISEMLESPEVTPQKAQQLKTALTPLLQDETVRKSPEAKRILEKMLDEVNAARGGASPYIAKEAASDLARLDSLYKSQSKLAELLDVKEFADLNDPKSQVDIINSLMKKIVNSAEAGKAGTSFRTLEEKLVPEMETVFGPKKAQALMDEAKNIAKKYRLSTQMTGEQGLTSDPSTLFIQARGIPLVMGHEAALAAKATGDIVKRNAAGMSRAISKLTGDPERLNRLATSAGGKAGRMLGYIAGQPESRRRSLLFAAMQQPALREALAPEFGEDDEL